MYESEKASKRTRDDSARKKRNERNGCVVVVPSKKHFNQSQRAYDVIHICHMYRRTEALFFFFII